MTWAIEYYSEKVRLAVDDWPLGIRAFYARITERTKIGGPNLDKTPLQELETGRKRLLEVQYENTR